jgi:hypothetical protein
MNSLGKSGYSVKFKKIHPPHPLKGKKYRGVSWKPIEILDRKHNRIGKLNASQRHTASTARRRAEEYCTEYKRALAEQKKNPHQDFLNEPMNGSDEPPDLGSVFSS